MELTKTDGSAQVEIVVADVRELNELQLALVGGGIGETVLAGPR